MACCIVLAALIAVLLWLPRHILPRSQSPLAWRLHGEAEDPTGRDPFTLSARLRSFACAFRGLSFLLRNEHNAWIHLAASVLVIALGLTLGLNHQDWRWLIAAVAWVWFAEALNTALEKLCDVVSPGPNHAIGLVKDIAAGAVLISAVGALALGAAVLSPYLLPETLGADLGSALCRAAP